MIKYTSSTIDGNVSKLLKRMTPEVKFEFDNMDWQFLVYKRTKDWKNITTAVGAMVWTKKCDVLPEVFEFDLFFNKTEFIDFVKLHKQAFDFYKINKDQLKPLSECSKILDMDGKPIQGSMEEPSEYAFTKAAMYFINRPHVSEYELMDAIETTILEQTLSGLVDDGLLDVIPPKENDCEMNTIYKLTDFGKGYIDELLGRNEQPPPSL